MQFDGNIQQAVAFFIGLFLNGVIFSIFHWGIAFVVGYTCDIATLWLVPLPSTSASQYAHYLLFLQWSVTKEFVRTLFRTLLADGPSPMGPPQHQLVELTPPSMPIFSYGITTFVLYHFASTISFMTSFIWYFANGGIALAGILYIWVHFIDPQGQRLLSVVPLLLKLVFYVLSSMSAIFSSVVALFGRGFKVIETLIQGPNPYQATRTLNAASPLYTYNKLDSGRSIRLVKLFKRHPLAMIEAELLLVSLDDAPQFEAISYTWGSPERTHKIQIGDSTLPITKSTFEALQDRVRLWQPRLLWIDSMCINQSDLEEKADQVSIMRDIYLKAERVVVCLGDAPDAQDAIDMLARLYGNMLLYKPDDEQDLLRQFREQNPSETRWPALIRLLNNPYWGRVWIVQEIALARRACIRYGGQYLDWDYFSNIIRGFTQLDMGNIMHVTDLHKLGLRSPAPAFVKIYRIWNLRRLVQEKEPISLSWVLLDCRDCESTNPLDKVYGPQGMLLGQELPLHTDYSLSVEDVYSKATNYVLHEGMGTTILASAGIGSSRSLPSLPSWSVDWTRLPDYPALAKFEKQPRYRASGAMTNVKQYGLNPNGRKLPLEVMIVDRIENVDDGKTQQWKEDVESEIMLRSMADFHQATLNMVGDQMREPYATGESLIDAYWRTLIGDRVKEARPAPAECRQMYESWAKMVALYSLPEEERDRRMDDPATISEREVYLFTKFQPLLSQCLSGRRFGITTRNLMGLLPPLSKPGDIVCIPLGSQVPFLIRPASGLVEGSDTEGKNFQLVGDCYLHGLMDGQLAGAQQPELINLW